MYERNRGPINSFEQQTESNKGNSFGLEPEIGRMALVDIQKLVHRMKKPHMTYPSYRSDLI